MKSLVDRLRDRCKVDDGGCWIWQQYCCAAGYPAINIRELTRHPVTVRRLMYIIACGTITKGASIQTSCGELKCVNPEHLVMRSKKRIAADSLLNRKKPEQAILAGKKTSAAKGLYKLNQAKADEIRAAKGSAYELAERYDVTTATIYKIRRNEMWATPKASWVVR